MSRILSRAEWGWERPREEAKEKERMEAWFLRCSINFSPEAISFKRPERSFVMDGLVRYSKSISIIATILISPAHPVTPKTVISQKKIDFNAIPHPRYQLTLDPLSSQEK